MADAKVEIHGLKELSVAFRRVDKTLVGELKVSFRGLAEHVVGVITGRMPRRSGKAVASVKPRGTTRAPPSPSGAPRPPTCPGWTSAALRAVDTARASPALAPSSAT